MNFKKGFAPALVLIVVGLVAIVVLSSYTSNRQKSTAPKKAEAESIVYPVDPADDSYFSDKEFDFDNTLSVNTALASKSITVNLNAPKPANIKHSAIGFLVSSIPTNADKSLVLDLKPTLYRTQSNYLAPSGDFNYQLFHNQAGSSFQIFTAADYFCKYLWAPPCTGSSTGPWPGDNNNWQPWEDSVRLVVDRVLGGGYQVEYDIWNEPNISLFWKRDQSRFNQTWKRAYQIIKQKDPQAKIVGPSISKYDKTWLVNFLTFAKTNGVLPQILSWHELDGVPKASLIESNVRDIKSWMSSNGISVESISINEILPPNNSMSSMVNSGLFIQYANALEKAGVKTATKSCWPEVGTDENTTNCFSNSLDGLLTQDTHQKRGFWYTYKAYGDMTGALLAVTQPSGFPTIASYDQGQGTTQVLVGNNAGTSYNMKLKISNNSAVARANNTFTKVTIQNIPSSGKKALDSFPASLSFNYFITSSQINLSLPTFSGYGAYKVVLSNVTNPYPLLVANIAINSCTTTTSPIMKISWDKAGRPDSKVRVTVDTDKLSTNGYYYKDVAAGTLELITNKFTGAGTFAGQTLTLAKGRAYNVSIKYNVTNEKSDWKTFKVSSNCTLI